MNRERVGRSLAAGFLLGAGVELTRDHAAWLTLVAVATGLLVYENRSALKWLRRPPPAPPPPIPEGWPGFDVPDTAHGGEFTAWRDREKGWEALLGYVLTLAGIVMGLVLLGQL